MCNFVQPSLNHAKQMTLQPLKDNQSNKSCQYSYQQSQVGIQPLNEMMLLLETKPWVTAEFRQLQRLMRLPLMVLDERTTEKLDRTEHTNKKLASYEK